MLLTWKFEGDRCDEISARGCWLTDSVCDFRDGGANAACTKINRRVRHRPGRHRIDEHRWMGNYRVGAASIVIDEPKTQMTLSEAFKVKLFCPSCRTKGQAICEEIEADGKFDRLVLAVSNGFEGGGRLDGTDQVICSKCKNLVPI